MGKVLVVAPVLSLWNKLNARILRCLKVRDNVRANLLHYRLPLASPPRPSAANALSDGQAALSDVHMLLCLHGRKF